VPLAPRIRESVCGWQNDSRRRGGSISPESASERFAQTKVEKLPRDDSWLYQTVLASAPGNRCQESEERDCENWFARYQQRYAPTVVNNSIGTLRAVFDEAISTGARFNNPAAALSRIKVRQKQLELPS